ncbi:MAG: stage 0 sporulation protein [Dehalococcoidia bacterium]|nr:stage 0 sporulation protein [Dehalococcoidia bacterium]
MTQEIIPTTNIIKVRFESRGELFYCDAGDISVQAGNYLMVETNKGPDVAKIIVAGAQTGETNSDKVLLKAIRIANSEDLEQTRQEREKEALAKCKEQALQSHMDLKVILTRYNQDFSRLTVYFKAKKRIDFRNLVRNLSHIIKTRIELKQVGPRDEARLITGVGMCGYPLCCQGWLTKPVAISIKMAKQQDLTPNPTKISGICGRLLCCLAYEHKQYMDTKEKMPRLKQEVSTPFGKGRVTSTHTLKETVTVEINGNPKELALEQIGTEEV